MSRLAALVAELEAELEARVLARVGAVLETRAKASDPNAMLSANQVRALAKVRKARVNDALVAGRIKAKQVAGRWMVRRGDAI